MSKFKCDTIEAAKANALSENASSELQRKAFDVLVMELTSKDPLINSAALSALLECVLRSADRDNENMRLHNLHNALGRLMDSNTNWFESIFEFAKAVNNDELQALTMSMLMSKFPEKASQAFCNCFESVSEDLRLLIIQSYYMLAVSNRDFDDFVNYVFNTDVSLMVKSSAAYFLASRSKNTNAIHFLACQLANYRLTYGAKLYEELLSDGVTKFQEHEISNRVYYAVLLAKDGDPVGTDEVDFLLQHAGESSYEYAILATYGFVATTTAP